MNKTSEMHKISNSRRENLEESVYRTIKEMIFRYQISPGQKLQYQDLASKLGVSRTPVKNAMIILEREGFLKSIPKKGYYVVDLTKKEAEDLFEIREALETVAGRCAVQKGSEEGLVRLKEIKELYERSVEEELSRSRFFIDRDFHVQIARMSGNAKLIDLLKQTLELIFLKHRLDGVIQQRGHIVKEEHNRIYDAIVKRDIEAVVEAIKYHNQNHKENVMSVSNQRLFYKGEEEYVW